MANTLPKGPARVPDVRERKALFLKEFEQVPQRSKACKLAGVPYATVAKWLTTDKELAKRVQEIREAYLATIGDSAEQAVIDGVSTPTKPNPWLALEVARQFHPDWKRVETGGTLTQVNIETAIVNPHAESIPTGEQVGTGGTEEQVEDLGT